MATVRLDTDDDTNSVDGKSGCFEVVRSTPSEETVTFRTGQCFVGANDCAETMTWLQVKYTGINGEVCEKTDNMCFGATQDYTAKCVDGKAEVKVFAYDSSFTSSNTPEESGCSDWPTTSSSGENGNSCTGSTYESGSGGGFGSGITVDGDTGEWDNDDFLIEMHQVSGRSAVNSLQGPNINKMFWPVSSDSKKKNF